MPAFSTHKIKHDEVLDVYDVFRRDKRRKNQSDRIGQKGHNIQRAETEPDQRYHGWQDGDQTMQIERDVRGGGMAMLRVVSMGLVEWIGARGTRQPPWQPGTPSVWARFSRFLQQAQPT